MDAKYSSLGAASNPPIEGNLRLEPCRESTLGVPLLEKSCGNLLLGGKPSGKNLPPKAESTFAVHSCESSCRKPFSESPCLKGRAADGSFGKVKR